MQNNKPPWIKAIIGKKMMEISLSPTSSVHKMVIFKMHGTGIPLVAHINGILEYNETGSCKLKQGKSLKQVVLRKLATYM